MHRFDSDPQAQPTPFYPSPTKMTASVRLCAVCVPIQVVYAYLETQHSAYDAPHAHGQSLFCESGCVNLAEAGVKSPNFSESILLCCSASRLFSNRVISHGLMKEQHSGLDGMLRDLEEGEEEGEEDSAYLNLASYSLS